MLRPNEALEAARHLGTGQFEIGERLELLAWINEQRGDTEAEISALERWLEVEPTATRAMERLAVLAHGSGRSNRLTDLRRRKAEVERALRVTASASG